MPFDISTAKPLEKSKFDISTARPIEEYTKDKFDSGLAIAGAGAAALTGGLGYALIRPELRSERGRLLRESKDIQSNLGIIKGSSPEDIASKINVLKEYKGSQARSIIGNLETSAKMSKKEIANLQNSIVSLDTDTINPAINKLSSHIKANYPEWLKSASDKYSASLDSLDNIFEKSGVQLTNSQVESNVIDKTISEATKQGFSDDLIKPLISAKKILQGQSTILGANGKPIETGIRFSDVKSVISNIINEDPYSAPSSMLRENWGKFLESTAPAEATTTLKAINESYKPFAQARTALSKIADPKTGEFDTTKLNKYLANHIIKGADNGTDKLIGALSGHGTLANPIPEVAEQFSNLKQLSKKRGDVLNTVKQVRIKNLDTPEKINLVKQKFFSDKAELLKTKSRVYDINSRIKVLNEKIPTLNPLKIVGKAAGSIMRGGIRAMGPIGMVSQAVQLSSDPENALRSMYFLPTKEEENKKLDENLYNNLRDIDTAVTSGNISRDKAKILADELRFIRAGGI